MLKRERGKTLKLTSLEISDSQLWIMPVEKSNAYRYQKGATADYFRRRDKYFTDVFTLLDQLRGFIKTCIKNQTEIALDNEKLQQYFESEAKDRNVSPDDHRRIKKLNKWAVAVLSPYTKLSTGEPRLRHICRECEDLVDEQYQWCPMNTLDVELGLFFRTKRLDREIFRDSLKLCNGNAVIVESYTSTWAKKLDLKSEKEETVLKNGIMRCLIDSTYLFNPSVLIDMTTSEKWVSQCYYISSFSPRVLGLNEKMFTPQQMETPIHRVVRDHKIMSEISSDLSSLQFYVCPSDILYTLHCVMQKIDEFATAAQLERKFGQFVKMVEGDASMRRKFEFMSFDDCFSLFFVILAVDPPRNACVLCEWIDSAPDLVQSGILKCAKITFMSAVQHIMEFKEEQLVLDPMHLDEDDDPLGVSGK